MRVLDQLNRTALTAADRYSTIRDNQTWGQLVQHMMAATLQLQACFSLHAVKKTLATRLNCYLTNLKKLNIAYGLHNQVCIIQNPSNHTKARAYWFWHWQ